MQANSLKGNLNWPGVNTAKERGNIMMKIVKTRTQIIRESKRIYEEIIQIFNDAEYWNNNVRKPDEQMIDPDPGRTLIKMKKGLREFLVKWKGVLS